MVNEVFASEETVALAKQKACDLLGVTENEVDFEILQHPSKKMFGMFGGKTAQVKAVLKTSVAQKAVNYLKEVFYYMGLKNRYDFVISQMDDMHPGISAKIVLDREDIGIIGRVHPNVCCEDVFVCELSLNKLMKKIKPFKFKQAPKYPGISKDMAFIVGKDIMTSDIIKTIKKTGGRLLKDVSVFDVYTGDKVGSSEKSIAFSLLFESEDRTLTDIEVIEIFNNVIDKVVSSHNAKLRNS